jgi:hypothetical protein
MKSTESINRSILSRAIIKITAKDSIHHESEIENGEECDHFPKNQQLFNEEQRELVANGRRNTVNNNIAAEAQQHVEQPLIEPRNNLVHYNDNSKVATFLNKSLAKSTEFVGGLVNSKTLLKYSADLGNVKSLHKLADICYKKHDYDEAEKLYTILAEVHQNSRAMYMLAAISLEVRNNLDATIVWYKWAIATDNQNFSAITSLAKIYYAQGIAAQGIAGQARAFKEAYELLKSAFPVTFKFVFGCGDKHHEQYFEKDFKRYKGKNPGKTRDDFIEVLNSEADQGNASAMAALASYYSKYLQFGDKQHEQYFENDFKLYKDKNPKNKIDDFVEVLKGEANQGNASAMLALASYYYKEQEYRSSYEFGRRAYERVFFRN